MKKNIHGGSAGHIQHMQGAMMMNQNFIYKLNRITQWSLLLLVVFGGGALVFILGIILVYLIASGAI